MLNESLLAFLKAIFVNSYTKSQEIIRVNKYIYQAKPVFKNDQILDLVNGLAW